MRTFRMRTAWNLVVRHLAVCLALLVVTASTYPLFWRVALPAVAAQNAGPSEHPEPHRDGSSCRCTHCAGPSSCACDHGTPSKGSVCGHSQQQPINLQDAMPPVTLKMTCEVPRPPAHPERWMMRGDDSHRCPGSPSTKEIDKVPISCS